jgi:hypothetical protein
MDLDRFVGIPWQAKGRSLQAADCWGICYLVHAAVGNMLPSFADDYMDPADRAWNAALIDGAKPAWDRVPFGGERDLDVILMTEAGVPCHIGVVARPGLVLHAVLGKDSVIEPYTTGKLRHRIAGIYRYRGAHDDSGPPRA